MPAGLSGIRSSIALAVVACVAFCLIGAAPALAAPGWLPATDVSKPGRDAFNPSVAVDQAGNAVALWERQNVADPSHNIQFSARPVGGVFSEPVDIAGKSTEPRLAIAPGGEAVGAWKHFRNPPGHYVIQVATRPPGGSFTAPADVYTAPLGLIPQELDVAIGAGGAVAAAWTRVDPDAEFGKVLCDDGDPKTNPNPPCPNPSFVEASVRLPGGSFSPPVRISPPRGEAPEGEEPAEREERERKESQLSASGPQVGVDAAGNVTAVWAYFDGTNRVTQAARAPAGGGFGAPVTISEAGEDAGNPDLGVDNAGNALAAWSRTEGAAGRRVTAALAPPGAAFGGPVPISPADEVSETPSVSVSPGGAATVVWRLSGLTESFIQASSRTPAGSFSPPISLSSGKDNPLFAEVAANDALGSVTVWSGNSGTNEVVRSAVRLPGAAGFGSPANVSPAGAGFFHPGVGIDAAGNAMAIWTKDNGTHDIVQAAGFDAAAPELRNLSIPATGVVGVPVSFSVAPFDAWPIGPATFAFGDGSEATGNATSHSYGAPGSYPVSVAVTDVAGNVTSQTATIAISPRPGFKIGKLKRNRKKGTGRLPITVEGPGTVVLSGKGVKRSRARAARAGTVQLKVRAVGRKLKKLNRTGKVRLALKITFTPDGGTPKTQRLKAKLVKNPA